MPVDDGLRAQRRRRSQRHQGEPRERPRTPADQEIARPRVRRRSARRKASSIAGGIAIPKCLPRRNCGPFATASEFYLRVTRREGKGCGVAQRPRLQRGPVLQLERRGHLRRGRRGRHVLVQAGGLPAGLPAGLRLRQQDVLATRAWRRRRRRRSRAPAPAQSELTVGPPPRRARRRVLRRRSRTSRCRPAPSSCTRWPRGARLARQWRSKKSKRKPSKSTRSTKSAPANASKGLAAVLESLAKALESLRGEVDELTDDNDNLRERVDVLENRRSRRRASRAKATLARRSRRRRRTGRSSRARFAPRRRCPSGGARAGPAGSCGGQETGKSKQARSFRIEPEFSRSLGALLRKRRCDPNGN